MRAIALSKGSLIGPVLLGRFQSRIGCQQPELTGLYELWVLQAVIQNERIDC